MYNIRTYNNIAARGLGKFKEEKFNLNNKNFADDHAILLRSHVLNLDEVGSLVNIVARAGVGTNNIPIKELTKKGIVVVNTPGANANAVKELVIASMIMAKRKLASAWMYAQDLQANKADIKSQVEAGKKQFSGEELVSATLGVIGLGSIGVQVANAALSLGMRVIGYDPQISIKNSWQLSASVEQAQSLNEVLAASNILTVHVPLNTETKSLLRKDNLSLLPRKAVLLNFARDEIIDKEAVKQLLQEGHLANYFCDFPDNYWQDNLQVNTFPHLGASTFEAEENCAVMAANQIVSYLKQGSIINAINLPNLQLDPVKTIRITMIHENVPKMVSSISTMIAAEGININQLYNKSKADLAYTVLDLSNNIGTQVRKALDELPGVYKIRVLESAL